MSHRLRNSVFLALWLLLGGSVQGATVQGNWSITAIVSGSTSTTGAYDTFTEVLQFTNSSTSATVNQTFTGTQSQINQAAAAFIQQLASYDASGLTQNPPPFVAIAAGVNAIIAAANATATVLPPTPVITTTTLLAGATTVSGTGTISATVTVFVNGVSAGTATVGINHAWSVTVTALTPLQVVTAYQTISTLNSATTTGITVQGKPQLLQAIIQDWAALVAAGISASDPTESQLAQIIADATGASVASTASTDISNYNMASQ